MLFDWAPTAFVINIKYKMAGHEEAVDATSKDNEKFVNSGKEHFFSGLETLVVEDILDTRETQV